MTHDATNNTRSIEPSKFDPKQSQLKFSITKDMTNIYIFISQLKIILEKSHTFKYSKANAISEINSTKHLKSNSKDK